MKYLQPHQQIWLHTHRFNRPTPTTLLWLPELWFQVWRDISRRALAASVWRFRILLWFLISGPFKGLHSSTGHGAKVCRNLTFGQTHCCAWSVQQLKQWGVLPVIGQWLWKVAGLQYRSTGQPLLCVGRLHACSRLPSEFAGRSERAAFGRDRCWKA